MVSILGVFENINSKQRQKRTPTAPSNGKSPHGIAAGAFAMQAWAAGGLRPERLVSGAEDCL